MGNFKTFQASFKSLTYYFVILLNFPSTTPKNTIFIFFYLFKVLVSVFFLIILVFLEHLKLTIRPSFGAFISKWSITQNRLIAKKNLGLGHTVNRQMYKLQLN